MLKIGKRMLMGLVPVTIVGKNYALDTEIVVVGDDGTPYSVSESDLSPAKVTVTVSYRIAIVGEPPRALAVPADTASMDAVSQQPNFLEWDSQIRVWSKQIPEKE